MNNSDQIGVETRQTGSTRAGARQQILLRTPTNNLVARWPTDPIVEMWKDLKSFSKFIAFQGASSTLRLGFAFLKWHHLHRAYLVIMRFDLIVTVNEIRYKTHCDMQVVNFCKKIKFCFICLFNRCLFKTITSRQIRFKQKVGSQAKEFSNLQYWYP